MKLISLITFILLTVVSGGLNVAASETPYEIMRAAIEREDGTTEVARITLSSCRYANENNRLVCSEKPRKKVMEAVRKDFGKNKEDSKLVTILIEPVGERGIGFLQFDYNDIDRETDQWIYLSALGKVKRIISGNENEPKDGSFFGSEFNYEDMESRHVDNYTYKLLAEETYQRRPCWVVESTPTSTWAKRSNYSKTLDWVDKERHLFLKTVFYNRQGKRVKRLSGYQAETINGIWVQRKRLMNTMGTRRMTLLSVDDVSFNTPVENPFLTQRTLTDKAFRERNLSRYRNTFN